MRIFFFTKYSRKGASSRYRSHQFLEFFRGVGVKTRCFPLFPDEYLEDLYAGVKSTTPISDLYWKRSRDMRWLGDCDLAVVEKEFFPYLPALFEKKAFDRAAHILLDFDDAIFCKYQYHPNPFLRRLLGKKIDRLMSWSDGVIGGNRFLCEYAAEFAPRTWTVPTSINTDKYLQHDHDHEGLVTIGWIGTPVTAKYLEVVRGAIEKVAREVPVRFLVIGAPAPAWDRVEMQSHEWSEEKEADWIRWMDIGIMPLEDTPWEKGKCGLKILQYMAAQVVPVVSDVGANGEIVADGKDGYLCKTEAEWVDRLLDLARHPEKRIAMGRTAREKVVAQYSTPIAAGRLLQIYREVAGGKSAEGNPVPASVFQPNES